MTIVGRTGMDDQITRIFFLILTKERPRNTDMRDLLELIGIDSFVKVVTLFSGRKVDFPTKRELRDDINLAFCYYYRKQGKTWDEIHAILDTEGNTVSSVAYGKMISSLDGMITERIEEILSEGSDGGK